MNLLLILVVLKLHCVLEKYVAVALERASFRKQLQDFHEGKMSK